MSNYKFELDYFSITGEKIKKIKLWLRILKNLSIRYIYICRLYENSKNKINKIILKLLIHRFKQQYGLCMNFKNIDGGVKLIYPNNIVINPKTIIGKNSTIFKGVLIGSVRSGKREGVPIIGDRVVICANAVVVGGIKIGNDVMIAPNSFVNFDVPDNSLVIGNPAKIHYKENPSKDYLNTILN